MSRTLNAGVAVVGGGPAGATLATRLAQLGHDVVLVERSAFPRRHLGESLTPGVLPLLETTGARAVIEAARFPTATHVDVTWEAVPMRREAPAGAGGLLVDRGRFDALLLEHARSAGVRVLQPAVARRPVDRDGAWHVPLAAPDGSLELVAPFLAVASGRGSGRQPERSGPRTLALYAYWRATRLPDAPRIEAGEDGWFWGVPIPDGTFNTLVFTDETRDDGDIREPVAARFHRLLGTSRLLDGCEDLRLAGAVRGMSATPRLEADVVTSRSIRVGDAALALDPLSSSGVQKALQTAVSGAIVANSILRRPDRAELALRFHRDALRRAYERHAAWAAAHHAAAATSRSGAFWRERAADATAARADLPPRELSSDLWSSTQAVRLSAQSAFVDVPCLDRYLVVERTAVAHPALDEPVAHLAGHALAPLLRALPSDLTPLGLVQAWTPRTGSRSAFALVEWLVARGVVELAAR